ncbi:DMT family transporter [uncultured Desulfobulbus sp.]|uniref:DMT family transporter n=1 Tax=uncultured Desulfobulbus sp. TaxID=239745 RepID=UPI0029C76524|nr:DMT family transporter [uncultured Desulfobulbus sp.]
MKHYLYAMGAIFCWASLPVATGTGLDALSIEELLFYSFSSAAIFLSGLDLLQKKTVRLALPGLQVSLLGIWGIFLYHYVYYQAMARAPLAEAAILATTWSFWIVVFSSLVTFRRLQPALILVALVGLFGAGLVIAAGKEVNFDSGSMLGYALALLCGLIWSSFSVGLSQLRLREEPMTAFTFYAALLSAVLFWLSGPHSLPSAGALLSAVYLGCVPLGLSFFLWNRAVTGGNMAVIGLLSYCTPPLAVLLVALLRQQPVAPQVLLGMGMIIAAAVTGKLVMSKTRKI